jgi:hypothetical protein
VTNNPTNFTDPDGLQAVQQLPKILDALSKAAAAIASAIAAGAAGKAILDRVLRGDREGEGRYYCEAKCTVVVFDPSRSPFKENPKGTHSFGYGYGRTLQLAIKAAKKSADNKIPLGCYNRHCFGIGGDCEGMPISY